MLHRRQAEMEKEIMGLSQIVKERAKAKAPSLPIDLVQRSVRTEASERQELHKLMEAQCTRVMTKQDEIPRTEKPATHHRYYVFVEDDAGYLVEQRDEEGNVQLMKDTDTNKVLPTDYITEAKAETYKIPEKDQRPMEDDAETISSTSTADYDWEEVETSLSTLADAFHTIGQEYEKLVGNVPHKSKIQAANIVACMPTIPFLKMEMKMEIKQGPAMDRTMEPVPSMSLGQPVMPVDTRTSQAPLEVTGEEGDEKEDDDTETEVVDQYFKKYILLCKGKDPEEKINEAYKEVNYHNLLVLIAVGDYIVNKAKNIQSVAKKWGLSFSAIQQVTLWKKEHSVGGRQYDKRKRSAKSEEKEEPV